MLTWRSACSLFPKNCHPLPLLAKNANRAIHDRMVDYGVDCSRREALWSTSAAVVRIKGGQLEWLQTGDAYVILIYSDNSHRVLVHQEDHDYETLMQWKSVAPASTLPIHEALKDQIRKVRCRMNRSYGVLNGEADAAHFFHWGSIPFDNVREVLLFTDGLSIPSPTPTRYKKFDTFMTRYFDLGLTGLKNHIRSIEKSDPGCKRFPRFKCHDDIAAISIKLTSTQPVQSATAV